MPFIQEYSARLARWNKHSDSVLLTFFDLDISYWEQPKNRRSREELFKVEDIRFYIFLQFLRENTSISCG